MLFLCIFLPCSIYIKSLFIWWLNFVACYTLLEWFTRGVKENLYPSRQMLGSCDSKYWRDIISYFQFYSFWTFLKAPAFVIVILVVVLWKGASSSFHLPLCVSVIKRPVSGAGRASVLLSLSHDLRPSLAINDRFWKAFVYGTGVFLI